MKLQEILPDWREYIQNNRVLKGNDTMRYAKTRKKAVPGSYGFCFGPNNNFKASFYNVADLFMPFVSMHLAYSAL